MKSLPDRRRRAARLVVIARLGGDDTADLLRHVARYPQSDVVTHAEHRNNDQLHQDGDTAHTDDQRQRPVRRLLLLFLLQGGRRRCDLTGWVVAGDVDDDHDVGGGQSAR